MDKEGNVHQLLSWVSEKPLLQTRFAVIFYTIINAAIVHRWLTYIYIYIYISKMWTYKKKTSRRNKKYPNQRSNGALYFTRQTQDTKMEVRNSMVWTISLVSLMSTKMQFFATKAHGYSHYQVTTFHCVFFIGERQRKKERNGFLTETTALSIGDAYVRVGKGS